MSTNQTPQLLDLPENPPPLDDERPTVDTTRPFRSVKEAVAIFGERLQPVPKQEAPIRKHTPNSNQTLWKSPERDQEPSPVVMTTLKKLEFELNETKRELKLLKERESETEVALASLNAELHKNMSKIAKAEAGGGRASGGGTASADTIHDDAGSAKWFWWRERDGLGENALE